MSINRSPMASPVVGPPSRSRDSKPKKKKPENSPSQKSLQFNEPAPIQDISMEEHSDVDMDQEARKREAKEARRALRAQEKEQRRAAKALAKKEGIDQPSDDGRTRTKPDNGGQLTGVDTMEKVELDIKKKKRKERKKKEPVAPDTDDGEDVVLYRPAVQEKLPKRRTKADARQAKKGAELLAISEHREAAIAYAESHALSKKDPNAGWKFSKAKQNWLLRHIWDPEAVSEEKFELVASYLRSIQGKAGENLQSTCKEIIHSPVEPVAEREVEEVTTMVNDNTTQESPAKLKPAIKAPPPKPLTPDEMEKERVKKERARRLLAVLELS